MNPISVIIPVYNTAEYLRACLDSILAQRQYIREIILVDDGSTDESAAICDEYAKNWPDLVIAEHQTNQGSSAARNRAIDRAKGEYLSFIDSDDYIEPDMYSRLLSLIDETGADMACGAMWIEKTDGEKFCRVPEGVRKCWNTREALVELNSYRYLYTSFCCAIFAREAVGELRFPVGTLCEDYYLLHQVVARCKKVAYDSHPVYHYIQRGNSNSRSKKISLAPMDASRAQLEFFRKNFPEIAHVAEADCAFAHMGIYTAYVRSGQECPKALMGQLLATARKYLPGVLKSDNLPRMKKLQALAFCFAPPVYRMVIARTEHR